MGERGRLHRVIPGSENLVDFGLLPSFGQEVVGDPLGGVPSGGQAIFFQPAPPPSLAGIRVPGPIQPGSERPNEADDRRPHPGQTGEGDADTHEGWQRRGIALREDTGELVGGLFGGFAHLDGRQGGEPEGLRGGGERDVGTLVGAGQVRRLPEARFECCQPPGGAGIVWADRDGGVLHLPEGRVWRG